MRLPPVGADSHVGPRGDHASNFGNGDRDGVAPGGVAQGSATFRDLRCCQRQEKPRVWQTTRPALRTMRVGVCRPRKLSLSGSAAALKQER